MKPRRTLFLVVGTRPEIIKQAPLYFAAEQQGWRCVVCFTGQHRDLGRQMLNDLGVRADHELDLMQPAQTPADFLGVAVPAIAALLRRQRPDWVAVQGDTTTALAGALAGFYEKVPVLHVEAGLRTYNLRLPFPEEGHRQLIARLATAHAAPTAEAANALRREGIAADAILTCGNTGIDCLLRTVAMLRRHSGRLPRTLPPALAAQLAARDPRDEATPVVLVTMHRRESFGPALAGMCRAFRRLARKHPTACLVWPVHPNPAVRGPVHRLLGKLRNVHLIEPQPFTAFAWLLERCTFIATDSGGLQEEGPALGKPVLILREVTERPEAVACGSAELVGCGERAIYAAAMRLLEDRAVYRAMAIPRFPYGDGTAAVKIITWLARRKRP